eukprot:c18465_g1_i5.p1 GENE.c18465_g1_i5~~c18465_g1_i5.p1  ORF type:complete len:169 (+),score=18.86 c18465_g1_i5:78-584(+)
MTMIKVLFGDMARVYDSRYNTEAWDDQLSVFDGDVDSARDVAVQRHGRCNIKTLWPYREDHIFPPDGSEPGISKRSRLTLLNTSYDLLVDPCDTPEMQDRYGFVPDSPENEAGWKGMWEVTDAFSLHYSPGTKPQCKLEPEEVRRGWPKCVRDAFSIWRYFYEKNLHV